MAVTVDCLIHIPSFPGIRLNNTFSSDPVSVIDQVVPPYFTRILQMPPIDDLASDTLPAIEPQVASHNILFQKKSPGDYSITDDNNKIFYYVKPFDTAFHQQLVVLDDSRKIIALLKRKAWSVHGRWNIYRGDSTARSGLMFSIGKESVSSKKICLRLSIANKQSGKENCDFKVKGSLSALNYSLYMGNHLLAESKEMDFVNDRFTVTVYPNVDVASVILVFSIIEAMKDFSSLNKNNRRVCDEAHVAQAVGGVVERVSGPPKFVNLFKG